MSLDKTDVVDAVGVEKVSGLAILTLADSWDWENEGQHLQALQAKLNAYFEFVESGQIWESYPDAAGRQLVIEVVTRFPLPDAGLELLRRAAEVSSGLGVQIRHRRHPD